MEAESISVEETNRLRVSLGLKPIPTAGESTRKKDEISVDETNQLRISLGLKPIKVGQEEPQKEVTTEEYQEANARKQRQAKLEENMESLRSNLTKRKKIATFQRIIGDEEDTGAAGTTDDWLNSIKAPAKKPKKKKVKAVSRLRAEEEGEELEGLKVGHSVDEIASLDHDVVLTLKDKDILDEEDELESSELVAKRKLEDQVAERIGAKKFNKYDGEEKTLMQKYDEELNGDRDSEAFFLSRTIAVKKQEEAKQKEEESSKRVVFSLDDDSEAEERSDYAKSKPVKMKKLKKKFGNERKREASSHLDKDGDVQIQSVELKNEDVIQDDFELQSILSLKRQSKMRRRSAKEIAEEIANDMDEDGNDKDEFVVDENSEFLSSIKADLVPVEARDGQRGAMAEPSARDWDEEMQDTTNNAPEAEETAEAQDEEDEDDQNVNFSGGIAATLSFLKDKNVVRAKTAQELEQERKRRELKQETEFNKLRYEIEKRKLLESLSNDHEFNKLSKKDREAFVDKQLEYLKQDQDLSKVSSKLKDYKPEVNLKYIDEFGREMDSKEAYKQLSHQFHGIKVHKNKVEKKIKKIEQERKLKEKDSLL